jgi:hypothetical protein
VYILSKPTFRRNISPPSSGYKIHERGTSVSRWLQTESKTPSCVRRVIMGAWAFGKSIERRGEESAEMDQQVAGKSRYGIVSGESGLRGNN